MWVNYTVEVKEGSVCGPGSNRFGRDSVIVTGDELTLRFQKLGDNWQASEVRVIRGDGNAYDYGTFTFHVKSVQVISTSSGVNTVVSSTLPPDLVLGIFTWDETDRYDVHENWNHEVDIEMSQWGSSTNADMQFVIQPPGSPQMHRFFSGASSSTYDQSMHTHSFAWEPGSIKWESTAGGGQVHVYTTEYAITHGVQDYVQCLPADVEIRLNLWNIEGNTRPNGLTDDQLVEVVIDNFTYTPSVSSYVEPGGYCSKHCQCDAYMGCINGQCTQPPTDPVSKGPTMTPTTVAQTAHQPSAAPSVQPPTIVTVLPTATPTAVQTTQNTVSPSPASNLTANPTIELCFDSTKKVTYNSNKNVLQNCAVILSGTNGNINKINKKIAKFCIYNEIRSACPQTCQTCPTPKPSARPTHIPTSAPPTAYPTTFTPTIRMAPTVHPAENPIEALQKVCSDIAGNKKVQYTSSKAVKCAKVTRSLCNKYAILQVQCRKSCGFCN